MQQQRKDVCVVICKKVQDVLILCRGTASSKNVKYSCKIHQKAKVLPRLMHKNVFSDIVRFKVRNVVTLLKSEIFALKNFRIYWKITQKGYIL